MPNGDVDVARDVLVKRLAAWNKKVEKLDEQYTTAQQTRDAIAVAIADLAPPKRRRTRRVDLHVDPAELHGASIEEAAIMVAERNGSIVQSTPLRLLLVRAGVLEDKKTASARLCNALRVSDYFEKVPNKKGHYRLLDVKHQERSGLNGEQEALLRRFRGRQSSAVAS